MYLCVRDVEPGAELTPSCVSNKSRSVARKMATLFRNQLTSSIIWSTFCTFCTFSTSKVLDFESMGWLRWISLHVYQFVECQLSRDLVLKFLSFFFLGKLCPELTFEKGCARRLMQLHCAVYTYTRYTVPSSSTVLRWFWVLLRITYRLW